MIIFLSITLFINIIFLIIVSIFAKRTFNRLSYVENIFEAIHDSVIGFKQYCELVLSRPMYTNEPIIMGFTEHIKNFRDFLVLIDEAYNVEIELPADTAVDYLEKLDDTKAETDRIV